MTCGSSSMLFDESELEASFSSVIDFSGEPELGLP